jgi:hypothetical protein
MASGKSASEQTRRAHVLVPRGKQTVHHPAATHRRHPQATQNFQVSFDPSLGSAGEAIAEAILATCEQDFQTLQSEFGGITPQRLPFHIIVTLGSDGASHQTCEATTLMIGARSGPPGDMGVIRQLVIAEEDEVFEANFGRGWDCGASNGEGLSRVLASDIVRQPLPGGFLSAPVWLDEGRPDFISVTDPSDINFISTGCAVLFLNWLHFQLGFEWRDIIAAGGEPLASTFTNLTGKGNAFDEFRAVVDRLFPPDRPSGLTTDNPFPV